MFRYICALSLIFGSSFAARADDNKPTPTPTPTPTFACVGAPCILSKSLVAPPGPSAGAIKASGFIRQPDKAMTNTHFEFNF